MPSDCRIVACGYDLVCCVRCVYGTVLAFHWNLMYVAFRKNLVSSYYGRSRYLWDQSYNISKNFREIGLDHRRGRLFVDRNSQPDISGLYKFCVSYFRILLMSCLYIAFLAVCNNLLRTINYENAFRIQFVRNRICSRNLSCSSFDTIRAVPGKVGITVREILQSRIQQTLYPKVGDGWDDLKFRRGMFGNLWISVSVEWSN